MRPSLFRTRLGRLLHHVFGLGVVAAVVITLVLGQRSTLFGYHDTLGLALAAMVVLRLGWSAISAATPRSGPPPTARPAPNLGRTLSTIVAAAIMVLVLGLAATGLMMGRGVYAVRGLHGFMAYALAAAALVHTALVVAHMARKRAAGPSRPSADASPSAIEQMVGQPR